MTALAEPGRAIRGGVRSFVSSSISSATMTARKLRALIANAAATPNAAMVRPASAGPMIRDPLNIAELRATALPTSSRPTSSMANDWRTGMSTALATAEQDGQDQDHPDLDEVRDRQHGQDDGERHHHDLGRDEGLALREGIRGDAGEQAQDHDRDELGGGDDAEPDRVAGQLQDEPRLGDLLHPRPDEGHGLAAEEDPVVAVLERHRAAGPRGPVHREGVAPDHGWRSGWADGPPSTSARCWSMWARRVLASAIIVARRAALASSVAIWPSTRSRASMIRARRSSGSWVVLRRSRLRSRASSSSSSLPTWARENPASSRRLLMNRRRSRSLAS